MLVPGAWNHRDMHEALSALLDCAFTELNLKRVEADTFAFALPGELDQGVRSTAAAARTALVPASST